MHEGERASRLVRPNLLARRYADDLEAWWASAAGEGAPTAARPALISGYSAGAATAHALAAELRRRGHPVGTLLLIDPVSPRRRRPPRDLKTLLYAAHSLTGRAPSLPRVPQQRLATSALGAAWYRGEEIDVPIVLFRSEVGRAEAWAPLTTAGLQTVEVPGDHLSITEPPDANVLGDALADAARQVADSAVTPSP
jgi:thioesterase domain-containing protein